MGVDDYVVSDVDDNVLSFFASVNVVVIAVLVLAGVTFISVAVDDGVVDILDDS